MALSAGLGAERNAQQSSGERGQAIILIAAAAVALMGMLAVVIDTGHLYAEQRQMQSAADAAAMAGAQNWIDDDQRINAGQAVVDARTYTTYNGYATDVAAGNGVWDPTVNNGVIVTTPPATGSFAGNTQYLEVIVSKPVSTFFAGIFNISTVQVTARAVARGMANSPAATVIALSNQIDAISTSGSSTTNVYGSIYSDGGIKCNSGNIQVYAGAAYAVTSFGAQCLSGQLGATYGLNAPALRVYDPRWPSFESQAPLGPGGNWSSAGQIAGADGYIHLPAGTYNSITVNPGDSVKFDGGVYHLIAAGDTPALTIKGNVASGGALQFVLEHGAVHFESQATGVLSGGPQYNNILIYSKQQFNGNSIQIVGGAAITYNGSIYAPGGNVLIAGNSSPSVNGQLVANTVTFAGSSGTAISWDDSKIPKTVQPMLVE